MSRDGCADGLDVSDGPDVSSGPDALVMFAKVNTSYTQSTNSSNGGSAATFTYPITSTVINGLAPDSNAISMRAFGTGQLAGSAWSEAQGWIEPIPQPTHAGSTGADAVAF